jgi:hypothetical protein
MQGLPEQPFEQSDHFAFLGQVGERVVVVVLGRRAVAVVGEQLADHVAGPAVLTEQRRGGTPQIMWREARQAERPVGLSERMKLSVNLVRTDRPLSYPC